VRTLQGMSFLGLNIVKVLPEKIPPLHSSVDVVSIEKGEDEGGLLKVFAGIKSPMLAKVFEKK